MKNFIEKLKEIYWTIIAVLVIIGLGSVLMFGVGLFYVLVFVIVVVGLLLGLIR